MMITTLADIIMEIMDLVTDLETIHTGTMIMIQLEAIIMVMVTMDHTVIIMINGIPAVKGIFDRFAPCNIVPGRLPTQFWKVTCMQLSSSLGSDIGGLPSSSV